MLNTVAGSANNVAVIDTEELGGCGGASVADCTDSDKTGHMLKAGGDGRRV